MNEVVIDSNIILRFIIRDDPEKYAKSEKFFKQIVKKEKTALISILVIQEVVWILEKYYKMKRAEIVDNILYIILLENVDIYDSHKDVVYELLQRFANLPLDLVDIYLHLEARRLNSQLLTYDEKLTMMGNNFLPTA
ncbi:hypothetical protein COT50_03490 [candidate division WWE3 bacterium CG08_land_8_20_14_0_20_41_10]|uniref:PIN domain-containing protein n=1 Tax=candidate division WWE3 bacterium CG08_land_8_20_14_0_20_41_10 TaxID=1975085 RepID=A0A2H0XBH2_UNCKA|nr:MAG: hypothetical protein COT50_03490 [candidate division WWE3 bacterium CG08_land_8_20_14_0_20_41_10]